MGPTSSCADSTVIRAEVVWPVSVRDRGATSRLSAVDAIRAWYRFEVTSRGKLLVRLLSGSSDQNIPFEELVTLLTYLGFSVRVAGSHHIFSRTGVVEILNLQPRHDGTAKPYQIRQVRQMLTRYGIAGENNAD